MVWYHWVPYDDATQFIFGLLLSGFVVYTVILYVCIFLWPGRIRAFYLLAMAVDLLFIFSLVGDLDKLQGSFLVAFSGRREHGSGAEEQQALEHRMIEDVKQRRGERVDFGRPLP